MNTTTTNLRAFEFTTKRSPRSRTELTGIRFGTDLESATEHALRAFREYEPKTVILSAREVADPRTSR
jgi:hypothetical protein